jgi:hypothetical protein
MNQEEQRAWGRAFGNLVHDEPDLECRYCGVEIFGKVGLSKQNIDSKLCPLCLHCEKYEGQRQPKIIMVWNFETAPERYRKLSRHGGDEDLVVFVPAGIDVRYDTWLNEGRLGNRVSSYTVEGGIVLIAAHA